MSKVKFIVMLLAGSLIMNSCGSLSETAKGSLLGGGGGAALGAVIGGLIGDGKGAAIGAGIGAAVGAGTGAIIGHKMDKAAEAASAIEGAEVEQITDNNGLQAVKVTFESGILFGSGASTLSTTAKSSLTEFANRVLKVNQDMDVKIYGYTENQGWRNSTVAQRKQKNLDLSQNRAQSVSSYLVSCGINPTQIKSIEGLGEEHPVADNSTPSGRQKNRRVEVYVYASAAMIQQAEEGTLQ